MLKGIVKKTVGGFYYVKIPETGEVLECKARGKFKIKQKNILVGDFVEVAQKGVNTWIIEKICERKNSLKRPSVANVDKAIIVFSLKNPDVKLFMVDKFLVLSELNGIEPILCLNKIDIVEEEVIGRVAGIYKSVGYTIILTSAKENIGIEQLKDELKGCFSVFVGPSGVGKSTLLNRIQPGLKLKIGDLSKKIKRGKHTTTHVELLDLELGGCVFDTPGFSAMDVSCLKEAEVDVLFPEMREHKSNCRFRACLHYKEPQCGVKNAVKTGLIPENRYESYIRLLEEIKVSRRN